MHVSLSESLENTSGSSKSHLPSALLSFLENLSYNQSWGWKYRSSSYSISTSVIIVTLHSYTPCNLNSLIWLCWLEIGLVPCNYLPKPLRCREFLFISYFKLKYFLHSIMVYIHGWQRILLLTKIKHASLPSGLSVRIRSISVLPCSRGPGGTILCTSGDRCLDCEKIKWHHQCSSGFISS